MDTQVPKDVYALKRQLICHGVFLPDFGPIWTQKPTAIDNFKLLRTATTKNLDLQLAAFRLCKSAVIRANQSIVVFYKKYSD